MTLQNLQVPWEEVKLMKNVYEQVIFSVIIQTVQLKFDTAQKMKFSITDFFSKYDQIRRELRIWSHLLTKSVMENFIFCVV